jgi:hypothetical protein
MKGSCQQTRTDTTAADRPPDAEKRRDTQRHPKSFRNPQPQLRLPTPGRAGQGGRPNPRPDSTESTTDTHGRPVGNWQLTCFRSAASASAGCPSCPAHPSSNYLHRLRRRPRRQPAVSAAAWACPLIQTRPHLPPLPRAAASATARSSAKLQPESTWRKCATDSSVCCVRAELLPQLAACRCAMGSQRRFRINDLQISEHRAPRFNVKARARHFDGQEI